MIQRAAVIYDVLYCLVRKSLFLSGKTQGKVREI